MQCMKNHMKSVNSPNPALEKIRYHEILLMVQKSGVLPVDMEKYPCFHKVLYIPGDSLQESFHFHRITRWVCSPVPNVQAALVVVVGPNLRVVVVSQGLKFQGWPDPTRIPKKHLKISELYENNIY